MLRKNIASCSKLLPSVKWEENSQWGSDCSTHKASEEFSNHSPRWVSCNYLLQTSCLNSHTMWRVLASSSSGQRWQVRLRKLTTETTIRSPNFELAIIRDPARVESAWDPRLNEPANQPLRSAFEVRWWVIGLISPHLQHVTHAPEFICSNEKCRATFDSHGSLTQMTRRVPNTLRDASASFSFCRISR